MFPALISKYAGNISTPIAKRVGMGPFTIENGYLKAI
jgi:hypothetical protein